MLAVHIMLCHLEGVMELYRPSLARSTAFLQVTVIFCTIYNLSLPCMHVCRAVDMFEWCGTSSRCDYIGAGTCAPAIQVHLCPEAPHRWVIYATLPLCSYTGYHHGSSVLKYYMYENCSD